MFHILQSHLFLVKSRSDTNLQLLTELFRVRDESTVRIPFVEPATAADLCRLLLPVH